MSGMLFRLPAKIEDAKMYLGNVSTSFHLVCIIARQLAFRSRLCIGDGRVSAVTETWRFANVDG